MSGFYQVSDKVSPKVVSDVTSSCERNDCQLSVKLGETTSMSTSEYYDKQGVLHIRNPNRFIAELCCKKCWKNWKVDENGNVLN